MIYKRVTKAFLNRKYDELYERAVKLLETLDYPCKITCDGKKSISCSMYKEDATFNLCCQGFGTLIPTCEHHGKNGCRVKSLRCKLWFCHSVVPEITHNSTEFQINLGDNYNIGYTTVEIMSQEHWELIRDMRYYNLGLLFRAGKGRSIEEALKHKVFIKKEDL